MRAHETKEYTSVLQLLSEPGCPICAFLKNTQATLLQSDDETEVPKLCNAHLWGVAAVRSTASGVRLFLALLERRSQYPATECAFCMRLQEEESTRVRELAGSFHTPLVRSWFTHHGVLCLPHGSRLRAEAAGPIRPMIDVVLDRTSAGLETALKQLMSEASQGKTSQSGVLGKAAEYLMAQRGLPQRRAQG